MRVLAIDPGYDRIGVAVLEKDPAQKERLLFSHCITTPKNSPLPDRLLILGQACTDIIMTHAPEILAIETLFFNKNIKTAIAVAEARGALMYIGKSQGLSIAEYSPQQIKVAVTGYGNSDKKAVTEMVKRLIINAPATAHDDEYDAIAVGITCLASLR